MKNFPNLQVSNNEQNIKYEYDVVYEYFLEYSETIEEALENLKKKVNVLCREGWIPVGAMANTQRNDNDSRRYVYQTLIRPIFDLNVEEPGITVLD